VFDLVGCHGTCCLAPRSFMRRTNELRAKREN
jgi:hypothetical protein